MKIVGFSLLFLVSLILAPENTPAQGGHYELVNLGTLGGNASTGDGINNHREITGRSRHDSSTNNHGFFWSETTGMVDLGTLGGTRCEGKSINDHGQIVGWSTDLSGRLQAFLWEGGSMSSVYSANYDTFALAINDEGTIVGGAEVVPEYAGFVRLPDGMIILGDPGSEFTDINDPAPGANALAVGYWTNFVLDKEFPIVYNTGLNTTLVGPEEGIGRGINRDGTLVGSQISVPVFAKSSNGYTMQRAPILAGHRTGRFSKVNSAGLMVGYNSGTFPLMTGVIYAEGREIKDINTLFDEATRSSWKVTSLGDANDHGYLTGTGTTGGQSRAVLLRPLDADGDGLDYYQETYIHDTNVESSDSDGDSLTDGDEISRGTNPKIADTDGDGANDGQEVAMGTNPIDPASNPGNEVVFPDVNLEAAVRSAIGLPAGPITIAHLVNTGFTELSADFVGIVNLSGLEYCRDLEHLSLKGNSIYNVTPLETLTKLKYLDLFANLIENVSPLSTLPALESLNLNSNEIELVEPLTDIGTLTTLRLGYNPIFTLPDMADLDRLERLTLDGCPIVSVEPLGDLITLLELHLNWCEIQDANALSSLSMLEVLTLADNGLENINFLYNLPNLSVLDLSENRIENVGALAGLSELVSLDISSNRIFTIAPLANLSALKSLNVSVNYLPSISPIANLTGLISLDIYRTLANDLAPLAAFRELRYLRAGGTLIVSQNVDILPLANLTNLTYLTINDAELVDIRPLQNLTQLSSLDLSNNKIRDLTPLSGLNQIRRLVISHNRFVSIDALVANSGLGASDYINLIGTPLSPTALCDHVPLLQSRGAAVVKTGDCGVDADGDGLADAYETTSYVLTDPNRWDSDGDALGDGEEYALGTEPTQVDTDNDGIQDGTEVNAGTDPLNPASLISVVYVDAASGNDTTGFGTRTHPWASLLRAVNAVVGTEQNVVSIYVSAGKYRNVTPNSAGLTLDSHEHLFGGYEAVNWTRDLHAHETILDASTAWGGGPAASVVGFGVSVNAQLDGFTLTGSATASTSGLYVAGRGAVSAGRSVERSIIRNCIIRNNSSSYGAAAGIVIRGADLQIIDCTIVGNYTDGQGGGIAIWDPGAHPIRIEGCTVSGNTAAGGGGGIFVYGGASAFIKNTVISGNFGGGNRYSHGGGGILNMGGIAVVANCTISDNSTISNGGGGVQATSQTVLVNCLFSGNRQHAVADYGNGIDLSMVNCLFSENPNGDYFIPNDGTPISLIGAANINANVVGAIDNIDGDPLFEETSGVWSAVTQGVGAGLLTLTDASAAFDPNGLRHGLVALSADGTIQAPILANTSTSIVISDDYLANAVVGDAYRIVDCHLEPGSAAIDMGLDTSAPEDGGVTTDFDGVARGFDGDGLGAATADGSDYDIGAYESNTPVDRITVLAPNGGESFTRGTPAEIRWESVGNVGTSVKILIRRGTYVGTLFGGTPNDGVHTWNIPSNYAIASGYTIEVVSLANPAIGDVSDAGFSIAGATGPVGNLTVTAPNGGESYLQGATVPVTWTSTGTPGANVDILVRRGAVSVVLASATPNDGAFNWVVPTDQAPGTDYVIEVRSSTTPGITDSSNAPFSISAPPTLLLSAPNGGESYLPGATVPIAWSSTGAVGTIVQLLAHSAGQTFTIDDAVTNDGTHDWVIPANQTPGTDYTIEVRSVSNPAIGDTSNAPFTIQASLPADSVTVLSPNGGEYLLRGTTVQLRWSTTGNVGTSVKIVLRRGAYSSTLFGGAPNNGVKNWSIPANYPIASDFTIEIISVANPAIKDASDAPFSITDTAPAGSIAVTAPNGGESYLQGGTLPITWTSTGAVGATVQILAHGAGQTFTLDAAAANDGAFDWAIPAGQPTGANYTIEVRSVTTPAITDSSNSPFAINAAPPAAAITLTAPNGGETYYRGNIVPITWTSTGAVGATVQILAHGAGQTFTVDAAATNDGAFDWTIPAGQPTGTNYTIEVRSVATPAITDSSNASFTINAAPPADSITLVSPNGGETFTRGSTVEFRWNSTGNVGNAIKIVLRRGAFASTLFGGTPNDGVHNWTIPANYPTGAGFTIEISSAANPAIGDTSDGSFSITAP